MPFSFQGTKSEDVAVDPHTMDFYQSQTEDIDIQGNLRTQQQFLDFENHFESMSSASGNIVDIALPANIGTCSSRLVKTPFCKIPIDHCGKYKLTTLFLFFGKPI